jgi:sulfur-oxidizing protein SoxY
MHPRITGLLFVFGLLAPAIARGAELMVPNTEAWERIQQTVFDGRPIRNNATDLMRLYIAQRAEDSAVVPVLVRTVDDQTPQRYIKTMWLIIDNNPSPVGVTVHLTPESGRADIETRVRIETFSPVRIVAETNDGALHSVAKTIIAAGGCSAPVMKTEAQIRNIGKMKFRLEDEITLHQPSMAQLMISHPNFSGLAINDPDTPRFVKQVVVSYAGKEVLRADVDFTISENPNFRFYFMPREGGELKATVVETNELTYESSVAIQPRPGS